MIVSGLARGIDTAAHDGALETGTIAVIAGGIDIFYPPENEDGSAGSASAACCSPSSRRAPSRTRATFLPATGSSPGWRRARWWSRRRPNPGSLITARHAAEYGREVMAVPGSRSTRAPRAATC